ncbi:hypothetical protein [Streptomyces griseocarneus]|uniref:hypothetical protein n=1 Tax=Streptomyces griseocarneus TaxID=51201 RepID=UPI00167D9A35|nr:hypothetical protein [Streptomyces griseocarneus]MBZ6478107.1 hypothetical protein [Streptomyces griseocarneus]
MAKAEGPLRSSGHGWLLIAFFATVAESGRENIRQSLTDDMLHTVPRRRPTALLSIRSSSI